MMVRETLLDSDILSALLKRNANVVLRTREYLKVHAQLTFSSITRYEILRGLKAKRAVAQLARFDEFCGNCRILPATNDVVNGAADIYAELYRAGLLIGDADILIAATTLVHELDLASNNVAHFERVEGLTVTTWMV
jgi:tRNA(fMet)-specific endonuclease VapC